jgi:GDP-mannose 6-dehydrogenase
MFNKNRLDLTTTSVARVIDKEDCMATRDTSNPVFLNRKKSLLKIAKINKKPRLSILGLGYVGAVSAACFSSRGYYVTGVDPDERKVSVMNKGKSPIVEEGLPELLADGVEKGTLKAVCDAVSAVVNTDITMVSVGTPTSASGVCNLNYLSTASQQIGHGLRQKKDYHLVIYRSTVPPKTVRDIMIPILEETSGKSCGKDFGVCFNPEFLRESTAIKDFYLPPKTVIGAIDKRSAAYAAKLYEGIEGELIQTSIEAAEFVKYIDNTWHALKVCFGNEVGRLCKASGIDSHEVMGIFVKDTKLNISPYYLKPGFAFGGSCLPKDTRGVMNLAKQVGVEIPLINNVIASNNQHINHVLNLVKNANVKKVGIVGVTFKAHTDDLRESPVVELMKQLEDSGHEISYFDPNVNPDTLVNMGLSKKLSEASCEHFFQVIRSSELVLIAHQGAAAKKIAEVAKLYCPVIDLVGLSDDLKGDYNYQGVCW